MESARPIPTWVFAVGGGVLGLVLSLLFLRGGGERTASPPSLTDHQVRVRERARELLVWVCDSRDPELRRTLKELRELVTEDRESLEVGVKLVIEGARGYELLADILGELQGDGTRRAQALSQIIEDEMKKPHPERARRRLRSIVSERS